MPVRSSLPPKQNIKLPDEYISLQEFLRRKEIWNVYFQKSLNTEAYHLYELCCAAFRDGNWKLVKEISQKAREKIEKGDYELVKPSFPDPNAEKWAGRLGVRDE